MTPTISAVTDDQVHRTRIFSACLVTPVGQPKRSFFSMSVEEQPVSASATDMTSSDRRAPRTHRLRRTGDRLSASTRPLPGLSHNRFGAYWTASARPGRGARSGYRDVVTGYLDAASAAPLH